ncbi:MAG TPA: hypothetical protein VFK52_12755 [Nocardioidaceae bacterium]|nr:hypothetical protein [Nocardioidaceae bacterium]
MKLRLAPAAAAAILVVGTVTGGVVTASTASADSAADARLARIVDTYSSSLGLHQRSYAAISRAALPGDVVSALAGELEQLYRCDLITQAHLPAIQQIFRLGLSDDVDTAAFPGTQTAGETVLGIPVEDYPNPDLPEQFPFENEVRACGEATVAALAKVRATLTGRTLPRSSSLDLWPVLRFAPGDVSDTYVHDYVLLVDTSGGNKVWNNAGGNAMDIWRGPAGSTAPIKAPARGCAAAIDIVHERTCTFVSAAALVIGDDNEFGRFEAPDPYTDAHCTDDALGRRIFTQGMGNGGVGVLIVAGSDNTFVGKVFTNGAGMIGGYGYQRTDGDRNHYTAIRSAYGAAIVGGIGTFIANGSDNTYETYLPGPKDPNAENGMPGSGGVASDLNNCDSGQAIILGAGSVGGVGHFTATGVGNTYVAPIQSLGFGRLGGEGRFTQSGGGVDTYAGAGAANRGNNTVVGPTQNNNGRFEDR